MLYCITRFHKKNMKTKFKSISFRFSVALNYQTPDKQNLYNRAQVRDNGGCGFVLKPAFLVSPASRYTPLSPAGPSARLNRPWRLKLSHGRRRSWARMRKRAI